MIEGFAREASVEPGGRLELHVSTDAPAFRVEFYRWGLELTRVGGSGWLDGVDVPQHLPFHDWTRDNVGLDGSELAGWPAYRFDVPADWPSGVYVAVLAEGDGVERRVDGDARHARALFVVRSADPGADAEILYKVPLLTYPAYNQVCERRYDAAVQAGGWCLYCVPEPAELPVAVPPAVSVRRPGGGTGGTPFDTFNPDPFDPTPRQTFVHWDALAVAWLERSGYRVDFCTDLDLHADGGSAALLAPYRLLLSFGHDEYWSDAMRTGVERYAADGGNVAFFSGNTAWWQVTFDDESSFRRVHQWSDVPVPGRPENAMTGVSFRNGGERPRGAGAQPVGFAVQHADHWVYAGTGLRDGDVFGQGPDEYLVGYECDGAQFDRADLRLGQPVRPSCQDGTPRDFVILGVGDVGASGWGMGNRAATLGVHAPGGTVFTAATTDWARVLARGCPAVEQITRNVIERAL
ncbi:MAG TPA: N,N-dimethylformamidase beta subunit family domain-containing protein [Solirubrobacteraceae bacterium]|nr:N,N-dimethylformamidase beta subunit family domain-containing protein [Solirubrobacteraceae bacterium]